MAKLTTLLQTLLPITVLCSPLQPSSYSPYNFKATFTNSPIPMTIDVDPKFIETTRLKASLTRAPIDLDEPLWTEGVPSQNTTAIATYWAQSYDWFTTQRALNKNFHHFTTTVGPVNITNSTFHEPLQLHFIHHKSPRKDAIPLLFIHGWPGSFLEVERILSDLINPPSSSDPAFHVIAPSLPGFGFSPAPRKSGLGLRETGAAFHLLMAQLGYRRYVVQGGDFGSHTARWMGSMFPESVVSILANLYGVNADEADLARYANGTTTEEEAAYIEFTEAAAPLADSFWGIEKTVPLQIGMLLGDSPVGNVIWPYFGMRAMTPGYEWTMDELITWGMMLYIQGPYGNVRIYKQLEVVSTLVPFLSTVCVANTVKQEGTLDYAFSYVPVPVGILQYYGDAAYGAPRDWCERSGNVTYFERKDTSVLGGHFPAHVNPTDLVAEIRKFWGSSAGAWAV